MTIRKPPPASSTGEPLPYPLSPEERQQLQQADPAPYSPSLLESPAFDLEGLEDAQNMARKDGEPRLDKGKGKQQLLPDILKIGGRGSDESVRKNTDGGVKRSSTELRRNYEKGLGGARGSADLQRPISADAETVTATPPPPPDIARPQPGLTSVSPPPKMAANLSSQDHPFGEHSPFYTPPLTDDSLSPNPSPLATTTDRKRPILGGMHSNLGATNSEGQQPSTISIASPVSYEPGTDLSSFDASYSRALPGYRGAPAVGMEGWQELPQEDGTAKTWEEDLERRARAGAELQRKAEEAQMRVQEEILQQEFWEQEHKNMNLETRAVRPPKQMAVGTGVPTSPALAPNNPWNSQDDPGTQAQSQIQPTPTPAAVPKEPKPPPPPPPPPTQMSEPPWTSPAINPATEIYTIKHVNLVSPVSGALHRFPILLQNANGPCPLMALVNAITIATPPTERSALSEILRLREQVSLSLLLQAVFEELMTRTPQDGQFLPDVSDLFKFLMTLHTGMNVNPRFNAPGNTSGSFEPTKELRLYAAFSIPLVHGWLPTPESKTYHALERSAKSYDETQTLLFAEDEVITRLTSNTTSVPSPAEQQLLNDAPLVREFIETTATQLTTHGLETLRHSLPELKPAILFRNDHFSTIIRRPSGELVALVTDMGFAGHEEVVWERIADVGGRDNVFLSGDFLPQRQIHSMLDPDSAPTPPPRVSSVGVGGGAHDEDYDFALAMQLQEEEDARGRQQQQELVSPGLPPRREVASHTPPPPYEHVGGGAGRGAPIQSAAMGRGAWMESQQRLVGRRGSGVHRLAPPQPVPPAAVQTKKDDKCAVM